MKMTKVLVSMPESMKAKLDALRTQGYPASGVIRAVLERELKQTTSGQRTRRWA
jgi:metal-responsive CopG/Arc/MetJ family transcriptional regulator